MPCPNCASNNITLQKKGPHMGEYCTDCGKWLRWITSTTIEEFTWPIGSKHKGQTLSTILQKDLAYLVWAAKSIDSNSLKRKAQEILTKNNIPWQNKTPASNNPQEPLPHGNDDTLPW
jgi:hypothetical protein